MTDTPELSITLLRNVSGTGYAYSKGETVSAPEETAYQLVDSGVAELDGEDSRPSTAEELAVADAEAALEAAKDAFEASKAERQEAQSDVKEAKAASRAEAKSAS